MGKLLQIDDVRNHHIAEMICLECREREVHEWPCGARMASLECNRCRHTGTLIATGELFCGDETGMCPFTASEDS